MAYGDKFDPADQPMPTPQQIIELRDQTIAAYQVPCRYCGAQPGQPCRNKYTQRELRKFGAHQRRITDAKNTPPQNEEMPF